MTGSARSANEWRRVIPARKACVFSVCVTVATDSQNNHNCMCNQIVGSGQECSQCCRYAERGFAGQAAATTFVLRLGSLRLGRLTGNINHLTTLRYLILVGSKRRRCRGTESSLTMTVHDMFRRIISRSSKIPLPLSYTCSFIRCLRRAQCESTRPTRSPQHQR